MQTLLWLAIAAIGYTAIRKSEQKDVSERPVLVLDQGQKFIEVPGYRRMKTVEIDRILQKKAQSMLDEEYGKVLYFTHKGKNVAVAIESHYHEPGGEAKPWGWHKGASLFIKS